MKIILTNENWNTDGALQSTFDTTLNYNDVAFTIPNNITHEALTDGLIVEIHSNSLNPIYDNTGSGNAPCIPIKLPRPDAYFLGMKIFFVLIGNSNTKIKFIAPETPEEVSNLGKYFNIEEKSEIDKPAGIGGISVFSIMDHWTFEEDNTHETGMLKGMLESIYANAVNSANYYTDQAIDNATGGVLTVKTIINADSLEFDLQSVPAGMNIAPYGANNRYILEEIAISSSQNGSGFVPSAGSTLVANVQGKKFTLAGLNSVLGGTKRWGSLGGTFQNTDTEQNPNLPIYLSLLQTANLNAIGSWQTVGTISIEVMVKYRILNPIN